jgi:hypothetical protein
LSGYTLLGDDGETPYYTYHSDRSVCDDDGCVCTLPSSAQLFAQRTADGRGDWFIVSGMSTIGPYTKAEARAKVADLLSNGHRPRLLRVVEDYT